MKKFFIISLVLFLGTALSAQIRNYVGIVRQNYYPEYIEYLEDLRDSLNSRGYKTYSTYIDSFLAGGFGSGFVYVAADGTNYVITNNHVVNQADTASIEFENPETGDLIKYDNLSILITDDDIDIAILKFKDNQKPFTKGLTLSSAKLKDGDEVYSAGFPGLGNEPVWQLGKGNVTNASARIKDLIDPSISTIIQHSAPVDAGNSGGPLMIASRKGTAGYEVVGINTWKAVGRDSTNFSLPVNLAQKLIEKSKSPATDEEEKNARLTKLKEKLTASDSDYTSIVKFISYEYAASSGQSDLENVLSYGASTVRNRVAEEFAYDPLEGIRYAVAYNFFEQYSKDNATDENLSKLNWTKEHGIYRLVPAEVTKLSKKEKSESKKSVSRPKVQFYGIEGEDYMSLDAGMIIPFNSDPSNLKIDSGFNANLNVFLGSTNMYGIGINFETKKVAAYNCCLLGAEFIFRVPLNFNLFCVSPKLAGGIGICRGDSDGMYCCGSAGIETVFNLGLDYIRPGFEVGYKWGAYSLSEYDDTLTANNLVFKLILGLNFD